MVTEQRLPAEQRYAEELTALADRDRATGDPIPPGWRLSARAVRSFVLGDEDTGISRKFYGDDPLVDRAVVSLLGNQGLMLVGEPGTAKSLLSELFAAAISGDSGLVVQGTAGTTEDHIRYSWNYALLLAEGPSRRALVPSPVYRGMEHGRVVRFEEITRCAPEIQDTLVSILSEKQLMVPELGEEARLPARPGFTVIATANLRDRGVNEMSAALKRRFAFETVRPIADREFEVDLVQRALAAELGDVAEMVDTPKPVIDLLVTVFQELRTGRTIAGTPISRPQTVMSTAEAVNVAHAAALEARYLGDGVVHAGRLAGQLAGVALKDAQDDAATLRSYLDTVVRERARTDATWRAFLEGAAGLWQ
ncbi:AAA family ATPase [Cellulomonas sp. NPDC089187]|uniref:ATP-binding protein n=1 Tax=Cellulomonas sp. NPDC089187 TaxID=3154970 RepID=UPI00343021F9